MQKANLANLDTFIYIDSSNIRNALRISNVNLDFYRLYKYLQAKYINLRSVKYFEGIDRQNKKRVEFFKSLANIGYDIKTLERKSYLNPSQYKTYRCINCKEKNIIKILDSSKTLKSNIDVYLCSEFMSDLLPMKAKTHATILTCDGDYAEMIRKVIKVNNNIFVSVFATPFTKRNNYLSIRLKKLESMDRFFLVNLLNIKDKRSIGKKVLLKVAKIVNVQAFT